MAEKLYQSMDRGDANSLPGQFSVVDIGSVLQCQVPLPLYGAVPKLADRTISAAAYDAIKLPNEAKAQMIMSAYARSGTGTKGQMTIAALGALPTAGQIGIAPNGDIITLGSDAYTAIDLVYAPQRMDSLQVTLPVASNAVAIPTPFKAMQLLSVDATVGTSGGAKTVEYPSASAATAGCARLDLAKANVKFNGTDAITSATFTFAVYAGQQGGVDVNAKLQGAGGV